MRIFQIIALFIFFSTKLLANTVTGVVLLDDSEDHSDILIEFVAQSNSAVSTSTLSLNDGSFNIELESGIYSIEYSKDGYRKHIYEEEVIVNSDISLQTITLSSKPIKELSGSINGVLFKDTVYVVVGNIVVNEGESLSIQPGTQIEFAKFYRIDVYGFFEAIGSKSDSILFTSGKSSKDYGDWDGLYLYSTDSITMQFCKLEFAGSDKKETAIIEVRNNTKLNISHSKLYYSDRGGIYARSGADVYINQCDFQYIPNRWGVYIENNSNSGSITNCDFRNTLGAISCVSKNIEIIDNHIENNSAAGIYASANCKIENNVIINSGNGIYARTGSTNVLIKNNTLINNNIGIAIYDNERVTPRIRNNIIVNNNQGIGYPFGPESEPRSIEYNLFYLNTMDYEGQYAGFGDIFTENSNGTPADTHLNIFTDPLFYEESGTNLSGYLTPNSPAIRAGKNKATIGAFDYTNQKPEPFNLLSSTISSFKYDSMAIEFKWEESVDLDGLATEVTYTLKILDQSNNEIAIYRDLTDTTLSINNVDLFNQNSTYKWIVESTDDLEFTLANDTLDFKIPNLPPSEIILISPEDEFTITDIDQVILQWEENLDTDVISYSVFIKSTELDTIIDSISNNFFDVSHILTPNQSYKWSIIASDQKELTFSDTLTFLTPNTAPADFKLIAPNFNEKLEAFKNVEFVWNSSYDLETISYDLIISNDDFDSLISVGGDTTISVDLSLLNPNTSFHWKIAAMDDLDTTYSVESAFITPSVLGLEGTNQPVVFPNPFNKFILVKFSHKVERIQLYELNGKSIPITWKEEGNKLYFVELKTELNQGVYLIRLIDSDGQIWKKRLVKTE